MAKVGFIVPVYKLKEAYLAQCVNSLRNQTEADVQIILVDDGSPDDCGALCDQYAREDGRITVVHHERNRGLPAARNSGLDVLDAQWVSFVDGDDWVDTDMCEKVLGFLDKQPQEPDIVIFTGYRSYPGQEFKSQPIFETGTCFDTYEKICALQRRSLTYVQNGYPKESLALDSACWRFIAARYIREKNLRFFDLSYREDGLFFFYSTEQAKRIAYLDEALYHYRCTGGSMVNAYRSNADNEHLRYLTEVAAFAKTFAKDEGFFCDLSYAAFVSMQICVMQQFFHPENPAPYWERQRACRAYFSQEPYRSVFRVIRMGTLRTNHWIKATCIRLHWYAGVSLLRGFYGRMRGKNAYE